MPMQSVRRASCVAEVRLPLRARRGVGRAGRLEALVCAISCYQVLARAWGRAKRIGRRRMWVVGAAPPPLRHTLPAVGGRGEKDAAPAVKK